MESRRSAKPTTGKSSGAFTDDELAAMREHGREVKLARGRGPRAGAAAAEAEVLAKIAELPDADRAIAERLHAIIKSCAPELSPRTWYGMPAYAKDGTVVCYLQPAQKFKTRYATFGFSDKANLDDGDMWPNAYAVRQLTPADEARIRELVRRAVG